MGDIITVDEKTPVISRFEEGKFRPVHFRRNGRTHRVREITGHWAAHDGQYKIYHFALVADTGDWEQKVAQALEDMDEVVCYVKNTNLGFSIPYTLDGEQHDYLPDFIARVSRGEGEILNLILEVSGQARKDKALKVATAQTLWVPAVNNQGSFGRWAFLEVTDPWNVKNSILGIKANAA